MFKIDKTLVDNMNMNKSFIVITHKDTVKKKAASPEPITLDDGQDLPPEVRERAQELMARANARAQQVISDAYFEAEEIKEAARQEGLSQGIREAAQLQKEQAELQSSQMQSALGSLEGYRQSLLDTLESHVLGLSLEVAEKIINLELEKDDKVYAELVKRAVDSLKKTEGLTLTVGRAEYEKFFKDSKDWLREQTGCGAYEVVCDHALPPGGCMAESEDQLVDVSVATQLGKIRHYLEEQVD